MAYKLVEEESKQVSGTTLKLYRALSLVAGFAGICSMCVGSWMLIDVERKIHEAIVDTDYSSTPTIIISLVLITLGIIFMILAYHFKQKGSRSRNFMKGTDLYWVKAYSRSGEAAPPVDELPFKTENPFNYYMEEAAPDVTEEALGTAFCPHCKKIVEIKSGSCLECGNPIVTDI